ncbi:MAG: hypothetical protein OEO82_07460 [Gammaproteobacteria bacterium]|nr:hypothetical protein [Gammaproteobacteria bacterium]
MAAPVFIGDEVTAAGYRLAGARVVVPAAGQVEAAFAAALAATELLLITAACAAELSASRLERAMQSADPLLLIVPDAAALAAPADLSQRVDRVLGLEQ